MKKIVLVISIMLTTLSLQGCLAFLAGSAVVAAASVATTVAITAVRVPIIVGEKIIDVAMSSDDEVIDEQETEQVATSLKHDQDEES